MSNIIQLTVEPHVETYITTAFGKQLELSDNNQITVLLKNLMEPFSKVDPGKMRPSKKYSLGGFINIFVSDYLLKKHGGYISDENIKSFSKSVDLIIKQNMYSWCHAHNRPDEYVDYNIKRFLDFYGFSEDDLSFDNCKRWYYRERERMAKRKGEVKQGLLTIPLQLSVLEVKQEIQMAMF